MKGRETREAIENDSDGIWETTDMSLAAWMRAKGKDLISIHRVPDRKKEFRFVFSDTNKACPGLALDFLNSEAHVFDTSLRAIKKLCFGPNDVRDAIYSSKHH